MGPHSEAKLDWKMLELLKLMKGGCMIRTVIVTFLLVPSVVFAAPALYKFKRMATRPETIEAKFPSNMGAVAAQEIATVGGLTYVYVADPTQIPADQPPGVGLQFVNPPSGLEKQISDASPQVALIRARVAADERVTYPDADRKWIMDVAAMLLLPAEQAAWAAYLARQPGAGT